MALSISPVLLLTLVTISIVNPAHGAKILLVPGPVVSHCLEMMGIGQELLKRGHHVTLLAHLFEPKPCLSRWHIDGNSKFKVVSPNVDPEIRKSYKSGSEKVQELMMKGASFVEFLLSIPSGIKRDMCVTLMEDKKILDELKDDTYDFALIEGVPLMHCFFAIPAHLNISYGTVSATIDLMLSNTPLQVNTYPDFINKCTNEMTFWERLQNMFTTLLYPYLVRFVAPGIDLSEFSEKLTGVDTSRLMQHSLLFIENSDHLVDYPKATMPNFVQAGGLSVAPTAPLPADVRKYLEECKNGVILVSFGGVLKHIPEVIVQNTLAALGHFKQCVLFKWDRDEERTNVKMMSWIPQNDVLGHPNVKLFISHCGKNGFWEAVYHAVPLICTPFGTDAVSTGVKVEKYGIGSTIDIRKAGEDEIFQIVNLTLGNREIESKIKKISAMLHDRPESASQRAASAVEHVLKYGGDHMKPPLVDNGFLNYYYADLWFVIYTAVICLIVLDVWLIKWCCCRKKVKKTKKE